MRNQEIYRVIASLGVSDEDSCGTTILEQLPSFDGNGTMKEELSRMEEV